MGFLASKFMGINGILLTLTIVNSLALVFIYLLVGRWCITTDKKLSNLKDVIFHISTQTTSMYMERLSMLRQWLIREDRFEEAANIDKVIKDEEDSLSKVFDAGKQD